MMLSKWAGEGEADHGENQREDARVDKLREEYRQQSPWEAY